MNDNIVDNSDNNETTINEVTINDFTIQISNVPSRTILSDIKSAFSTIGSVNFCEK